MDRGLLASTDSAQNLIGNMKQSAGGIQQPHFFFPALQLRLATRWSRVLIHGSMRGPLQHLDVAALGVEQQVGVADEERGRARGAFPVRQQHQQRDIVLQPVGAHLERVHAQRGEPPPPPERQAAVGAAARARHVRRVVPAAKSRCFHHCGAGCLQPCTDMVKHRPDKTWDAHHWLVSAPHTEQQGTLPLLFPDRRFWLSAPQEEGSGSDKTALACLPHSLQLSCRVEGAGYARARCLHLGLRVSGRS